MKIFVTGADGLLGGNLVRELIERGHSVRAYLLPNTFSKTLEGLDLEKRYGNILNKDEVLSALKGCEAIIHAAADTSVWPTRSKKVKEININGTKNGSCSL